MRFFSFSGYTKGLFSILDIKKQDDYHFFDIKIDDFFSKKILKKISSLATKYAFTQPLSIEVDGIPGVYVRACSNSDDDVILGLKFTSEIVGRSTMRQLAIGTEISLGLQSFNSVKYLVGQYDKDSNPKLPVGIGKIVSINIAPNHEHTQELTVEIPASLNDILAGNQCIGLNGSAFYIQSFEQGEIKSILKVHIGRDTSGKTIFGTSKMSIGQEVNITRSFHEDEQVYDTNGYIKSQK